MSFYRCPKSDDTAGVASCCPTAQPGCYRRGVFDTGLRPQVLRVAAPFGCRSAAHGLTIKHTPTANGIGQATAKRTNHPALGARLERRRTRFGMHADLRRGRLLQCPKVPNSVNNECQTIRNFTGLGAHRDLLVDADEEPDVAAPDSDLIAVPRGGADGKADWEAALHRRHADHASLAGITDVVTDVERRADELNRRPVLPGSGVATAAGPKRN